MPASDEEIATLANNVEACAELALAVSLANCAEKLHGIVRELDNALGDRLVRQYRGRFGQDPSS